LIVDHDSDFQNYKRQIVNKGFTASLNESSLLNIQTDSIILVSKILIFESRYLTESKIRDKKRNSGGKGAIDNPKEYADGEEIFVRISAYENDKRIDFVEKRLKDGTYTTTHKDYLDCVNTNDAPIDRYALPNDEDIEWAFYIQPKSFDQLQRGIVQPAFGHEGGGVEAYFQNGTSKNTYFDKRRYGK
jgi:hypothetical protein